MTACQLLLAALATLAHGPHPDQSQSYDFKKARVETLLQNGDSRNHVDIVWIGDGYVAEDLTKDGTYERDVKRSLEELFATEPLTTYRNLFNAYCVCAESFDRGAEDRMGEDRLRTILDCSFDTPAGRLAVYQKPENVMRLAKLAPAADVVLVMINDPRYGGSGGVIWEHTPAPCFTHGPGSIQIAVHELGHSLANLGDEYADPQEAGRRPLPDGTQDLAYPNLTLARFLDVTSAKGIATTAKWKHFLDLPGSAGKIGAFEGGFYREAGVFRPELHCKMRESADPFCCVCQEELTKSIFSLTGRRFDDSAYHKAHPIPVKGK